MGRVKDQVNEICSLYREGHSVPAIADFMGESVAQVLYVLEQYYGGLIEEPETAW